MQSSTSKTTHELILTTGQGAATVADLRAAVKYLDDRGVPGTAEVYATAGDSQLDGAYFTMRVVEP